MLFSKIYKNGGSPTDRLRLIAYHCCAKTFPLRTSNISFSENQVINNVIKCRSVNKCKQLLEVLTTTTNDNGCLTLVTMHETISAIFIEIVCFKVCSGH